MFSLSFFCLLVHVIGDYSLMLLFSVAWIPTDTSLKYLVFILFVTNAKNFFSPFDDNLSVTNDHSSRSHPHPFPEEFWFCENKQSGFVILSRRLRNEYFFLQGDIFIWEFTFWFYNVHIYKKLSMRATGILWVFQKVYKLIWEIMSSTSKRVAVPHSL